MQNEYKVKKKMPANAGILYSIQNKLQIMHPHRGEPFLASMGDFLGTSWLCLTK